ncbi:hypothetical protein RJT34_03117 [Clitoria ternatea]|uniref:Uncharacterized protein n=1 Tax=Clitoria ternatea TaxID=43366 RepID=A0AAN9KJ96_CLITE
MALTSSGQLLGWGWNKKVLQVSCGWRHTIVVTERDNVYSWGRGANGQLGHGETIDRNVPTIIVAFRVDGSPEQHIESSKPYPSSVKSRFSKSVSYAVVPNENASGSLSTTTSYMGDRHEAGVPESNVN